MDDERIDLEAFLEVYNLDTDSAFFFKQVDIFIKSTEESVTLLAGAISKQDAQATERIAHSIKGAALNFGAKKLAAFCRKLEEENANWQNASNIFSEIRKELDYFKIFLQDKVKSWETDHANER